MHYTIYKITNQINGKFYIGSHKTKDLNDNYMGSGKYLKHAQEKYGIENFKKEYLFIYNTDEEMYTKEAELVNIDFLTDENTYNLKLGGFGGFDFINKTRKNLYGKNGLIGYGGENLKPPVFTRSDLSEEDKIKIKKKISSSVRRSYELGRKKPFLGKTHSDETKRKIGEKTSIHQSGSNNSQYGTIWINNGIVNKKNKKGDDLPTSWKKGRLKKLEV